MTFRIIDKDLKKIYQEKKDDLKQIKATHIFLKSSKDKKENPKLLEKANKIREQIMQGADFGEMVKTHSEASSKKKGGDMGYLTAGVVAKDDIIFKETVFKLKKGDISPVITTPRGFHIVKVEDIRETFEELKAVLRKVVFLNIQNTHLEQLVKQSEITIVNNEYSALLKE
jgi:parvulin-like peptidyl-prolyl isomerase